VSPSSLPNFKRAAALFPGLGDAAKRSNCARSDPPGESLSLPRSNDESSITSWDASFVDLLCPTKTVSA